MSGRGVLTFAYGPRRFRRLAVALAWSLKLHAPDLPRAVVCDGDDPELRALFHHLVPRRPEWGGGFAQKLRAEAYTPFAETFVLDADCLVVRDLEPLWPMFGTVPVGVAMGRRLLDGHWYGDIATIRRRLALDHVDNFNGGLYYIRSSPEASAVYADARALAARYAEVGLEPMRGSVADEPVMALALARAGIQPVPDPGGVSMVTPLGLDGPLDVDVLLGRASFEKHGRRVTPAIVHFCEPYLSGRLQGRWYRRERRKLALRERTRLPGPWISRAVNLASEPFHRVAERARPEHTSS